MARTFTISLPDHLAALIDAVRKARQLPTDEACLAALVADALAQQDLETKLLKGLEGEPRELTDQDWAAKEEALITRHRRAG